MKLSCKSTTCNIPTFTKQSNNVSKKMLQAQMIRTNGRYAYKYSNSKTDTIHQIIISQNYDSNKLLLFSIGVNAYMNYYKPLMIQYKLGNVYATIIENLTTEERAILFCEKPPPVITPVIPEVPLMGKKYYVVSVTSGRLKYFVFKNYALDDIMFPTYTYYFDMSDPSNIGTKLAFTFIDQGPEITYTDYSTPNIVKLTLPNNINYDSLYPYNANEPDLFLRYKSGYAIGKFYVKSTAFAQPIVDTCTPVYNPVFEPTIYRYNNKSYDLIHLTASSLMYSYEYDGTHLTFKDIKSNENVKYIINRKYAMSSGTDPNKPRKYRIYVPQMYALAILNAGQETNISYTGDPNKATRDVLVVGTEADDVYDFYYGTIEVTVRGSFQPLSLYTLKYGYLHLMNSLVYAVNPDTYFDLNPYIFPF